MKITYYVNVPIKTNIAGKITMEKSDLQAHKCKLKFVYFTFQILYFFLWCFWVEKETTNLKKIYNTGHGCQEGILNYFHDRSLTIITKLPRHKAFKATQSAGYPPSGLPLLSQHNGRGASRQQGQSPARTNSS